MWTTGQYQTLRHIRLAPLGRRWAVRESTVANAQIFNSAAHAEAAARWLGERLAAAGHATKISIFGFNGDQSSHFICAMTRAALGAS